MSSAQKVPAWKRLGLKLKPAAGPADGGAAADGASQPNGAARQDLGVNASAAKRKWPDHPTTASPAPGTPVNKKARFGDSSSSRPAATPSLGKAKSVTFTDDTKKADEAGANGIKTPAKKTKSKKKTKAPAQQKQSKQQSTADIKPALEYLKAWKTSRDSWKFNKNHQTLLIKRAFDVDAIPSGDIETFYEYIRDLKGFTRQRLRDTALDVKKTDAAQAKDGFPEGTMDVQVKQSEYETIVAGILQLGLGTGTKRKHFNEADFSKESSDTVIAHRVIKRMRAELIFEELSDDDGDIAERDNKPQAHATQTDELPVPAALGEGNKPRGRRRKMRTAADDTSSEESASDSDSESDASDSSSSDESDSDDDAPGQDAGDTSSSDSTDSSDSESGSDDSDDDSDSEDEQPPVKKGIKGQNVS